LKPLFAFICVLTLASLTACNFENPPEPGEIPTPTTSLASTPLSEPTATVEQIPTSEPLFLSISMGDPITRNGISLDAGGDVDTVLVDIDGVPAYKSGNGTALISADGNDVPDSYLQFNLDDKKIFEGSPVGRVRLEVDYLDTGTDSFSLQYDAKPTSGSQGLFSGGGAVAKTDSGEFKTAFFNLCDVYFANRDNGADFRISDDNNGAEVIREVRVTGIESNLLTINVDDFGANPMDDQPDSESIQAALDSTCSGDTIVFTSGVSKSGYQGYMIEKTLFLTGMSAKHDLTFTASNPQDHALLKATSDLKGYVVRLFSRTRFTDTQNLRDIDFGYIDVHGGRDVRVCMGMDGIGNGKGDNWGSWLPECSEFDDPWCSPGNLGFDGFAGNLFVHDLIDQQGECGSGLAFTGSNGTIQNVTIDTVGDHVHAKGCANTDMDGDYGGWSDGITMAGPGHKIINNTIINPSDIGIVHFGGKDTIIAGNTIRITSGNYGAFGAIALHPWDTADTSGVQITGNTIINEGNGNCGGLHTGINLGSHMWGGACVRNPMQGTFGNPICSPEPDSAEVKPCSNATCQVWLVLPEGKTLTLKDNSVAGAHINYLIEGFLIEGQFIDENNISLEPRLTDWDAAKFGCEGIVWGPMDKVAHHPSLPGYSDIRIHCER